MRVASVNISSPRVVLHRGRAVSTSIFKEPAAGRVRVRRLSLDGDWPADLRYHGGQNKAVYAYPFEHYATWSAELGRDDLRPGQFGENLTVEGMVEDAIHLGDVYRFGSAVLQVTQARTPCFKLGIKMGSSAFIKAFLASGRPGFYLRVVEEGDVAAGDAVELVERHPVGLSVRHLWHVVHGGGADPAAARELLQFPTLGPEWREPLEALADHL
jgi:MOSC domain-containing protein YiiM